jgi:hypothetical protein
VTEEFFSSRRIVLELTAHGASGHCCVGFAHASHGGTKVLRFNNYANASWLDQFIEG